MPGLFSLRVLPVVFLAWIVQGCDRAPTTGSADIVFKSGAVYTLDSQKPWAEAVAVKDGVITYVGDEAGVSAHINQETEVISIGEGMLMPGFHDAHMHPMAAGTTYLRCPLDGLSWPDEVLRRLSECEQPLEKGEWLRATGLESSILERQGPGMKLLDDVSAGHPALITGQHGFDAWVNSDAMKIAQAEATQDQLAGEAFVREPESGELTGVLRQKAFSIVWRQATQYSQRALLEGLRLASQYANSLGITSASESAAFPDHWKAYRQADQAGEMTLRVQAALRWEPEMGKDQLVAFEKMREQANGPLFKSNTIKLFIDGDSLFSDASVLDPYESDGGFGFSNYEEQLPGLVTFLDSAGFDLHMHAYGDRAVRNALDAIEIAIRTNPPRERRHQLAHIALVHADDLPRFEELGVTANIQPLWAWMSDERREECEGLGQARCDRLFQFRDLFDSGARVVAGSDWISESMSPLYNIQIALTRQPPGEGGPPWHPEQRVTLEEMLSAYTINAAWQAGQEDVSGSIEVGKAADLIVLDRNLFEVNPMQLKDVRVLRTFLEGEKVYSLHQ